MRLVYMADINLFRFMNIEFRNARYQHELQVGSVIRQYYVQF
jgi:hypothetical protein